MKLLSFRAPRGAWLTVFSTLCLVLLFAPYAFAQTAAPVVPVQPISIVAGIGMVLGLLLGYINQGIASGSILLFGVPALWKPYLSVSAVFLSSFVPQFEAMPTLTGLGLFYAVVAGLTSLVTYSAGATLRQHHEAGGGSPPSGKVAGAVVLLLVLSAPALQGCAKVDQYFQEAGSIASEVVKDLQAGDTDIQIADDVLTMLGAGATVEQASNVVIDVLNQLIDAGVLNDILKAKAEAVIAVGKDTLAAKVHAAKAHKP